MLLNFLNLNFDHVLLNWSSGIYGWAGDVYQLIIELANQDYMDNYFINAFVDNVMVFVGVFTLFRLAIALIEYLINPDSMGDKKTGTGQLIVGVVVMLFMLLTFRLGFKALRDIENAILNDDEGNIIMEVLTVQDSKADDQIVTGFTCTYDSILVEEVSSIVSTGGSYVTPIIQFDSNQDGKDIIYLEDWSVGAGTKYVTADGKTGLYNAQLPIYIYNSETTNNLQHCPKYMYDISSADFPALRVLINAVALAFPAGPMIVQSIDGATKLVIFSDEKMSGMLNFRHVALKTEETNSYMNDPGRTMAGIMFFSFVTCKQSLITSPKASTDCTKFDEYRQKNNFTSLKNIMDTDLSSDDDIHTGVVGNGLLTLIFGIVLLLFLVVTTVDVAVRSIKLLFLQLLAPFPIMCYAIPKARETFNAWIKTIGSVYVDLFLRIAIMSIINFVISHLQINGENGIIGCLMVLGLLLFLKEAPQFVCNMLGIKDAGSMKGFTLNPFQKLREIPVVGGAMGAASGMVGGAISGAKQGGWKGAAMGGLSGGRAGLKNAGGLMGMEKGKKPQTSSGMAGSKAASEFMGGKGGFMSRTVGANAARSYVGNKQYKADEDAARDKAFSTGGQRSQAQSNVESSRSNLEYAKANVQNNRTNVENVKFRYANNMETAKSNYQQNMGSIDVKYKEDIDRVEKKRQNYANLSNTQVADAQVKEELDSINLKYAEEKRIAEEAYRKEVNVNQAELDNAEEALKNSNQEYEEATRSAQKAQDQYNEARSVDEAAQYELSEAERKRKKAQSVVPDKEPTASQVRYKDKK